MKHSPSTNLTLSYRLVLLILSSLLLIACGTTSTPDQEEAAVAVPTVAQQEPTPTEPREQEPVPPPTQTPASMQEAPAAIVETPQTPGQGVEMPTATPEPASPTPTASLGTINGRVFFRSRPGQQEPETGAHVTLLGREDLWAETDNEGWYTLSDVTPGLQWIYSRSPRFESQPVQVHVVAGQTVEQDLANFTGSPIISLIPAGAIVRLNGEPVAGAMAWPIGLWATPEIVITDENGYLAFNRPHTVMVVFGDRWDVAFLQARKIIDIELSRSGAVVSVPDFPVVPSVPRSQVQGEGPVISTLAPPVLDPQLELPVISTAPAVIPIAPTPTPTPRSPVLPTLPGRIPIVPTLSIINPN